VLDIIVLCEKERFDSSVYVFEASEVLLDSLVVRALNL